VRYVAEAETPQCFSALAFVLCAGMAPPSIVLVLEVFLPLGIWHLFVLCVGVCVLCGAPADPTRDGATVPARLVLCVSPIYEYNANNLTTSRSRILVLVLSSRIR